MEYEIIHLPIEKWNETIIPIRYKTDKYCDVTMNKTDKGYAIEIEKKEFTEPVTHTPEEYDFPDKLYADHWMNAYAWGVLDNSELVAAIETDQELWSNRLRITELWVVEKYQPLAGKVNIPVYYVGNRISCCKGTEFIRKPEEFERRYLQEQEPIFFCALLLVCAF